MSDQAHGLRILAGHGQEDPPAPDAIDSLPGGYLRVVALTGHPGAGGLARFGGLLARSYERAGLCTSILDAATARANTDGNAEGRVALVVSPLSDALGETVPDTAHARWCDLVSSADDLVVFAPPSRIGMTTAYSAVKQAETLRDGRPVRIVVDGSDDPERAGAIARRLEEVCMSFLDTRIECIVHTGTAVVRTRHQGGRTG